MKMTVCSALNILLSFSTTCTAFFSPAVAAHTSRLLSWLYPYHSLCCFPNPSPASGTAFVDCFIVCPDPACVWDCTLSAHRCCARGKRGRHERRVVCVCLSQCLLPDAFHFFSLPVRLRALGCPTSGHLGCGRFCAHQGFFGCDSDFP